jgi:hypothetical protein
MKLRLVLGLTAAVAVGVFATGATAEEPPPPGYLCGAAINTETKVWGTQNKLTITGNAYVPAGKSLRVTGGLTIAPGACLEAFFGDTVTISGGVTVGQGGVFGLGYFGPGPYTVNGGVSADRPRSLYLGGTTINGSVVSTGGGDPERNFPIKDNTINGGLVVTGWNGWWIGLIRNHVNGGVVFSGNTGADPDSSEVQTNVIHGDLACAGNSPVAVVNPDDGGEPNVVTGQATGQCAGLAG